MTGLGQFFVLVVGSAVMRSPTRTSLLNSMMMSYELCVFVACCLAAFSAGSAQGYSMVLLLQLRNEDSTIKLNLDTASWIGSIHGVAGITSIFLTAFMQCRGRKIAFMCSTIIIVFGWVLAYTAKSVTQILISETFHGCAINALTTIIRLTLSEMSSPKYRNLSIQSSTIVFTIGMGISGILSMFLDWRSVCLLLSAPAIIALLMSLLWPESPSWLAYKGRFNECENAFKQLRHMSYSSKKELEELVAAQKESLLAEKNNRVRPSLFFYKMKKREFYLPVTHMILFMTLSYFSGTAVLIINNAELLQKTTKNDRAVYITSITVNIVMILGSISSNLFSKWFSNKNIVLWSASCTALSLIGLTVSTLLQDIGVLSKEILLCPFFLVTFVVGCAPGLLGVAFTIISEILPVKFRGVGGSLNIVINCIFYSISLKISPYLFMYNIWATFLFFCIITIICGFLIWRFVPETKNRTLQQIEDFYTFGQFIDTRLKCDDEEESFVTKIPIPI